MAFFAETLAVAYLPELSQPTLYMFLDCRSTWNLLGHTKHYEAQLGL